MLICFYQLGWEEQVPRAVPIIAQMSQEMGILTVAVVTKPFAKMEGEKNGKCQ